MSFNGTKLPDPIIILSKLNTTTNAYDRVFVSRAFGDHSSADEVISLERQTSDSRNQ